MLPTEWPSRKTGNCEMPLACKSSAAWAAVASELTVTSVRGPRASQQVADRLRGGLARCRLVFGQPGVIVELAQIIAPGIRAEGDDDVVRRSSRRAYRSAAATAVPDEPPTSSPSRRAMARAVWKLSASPIRIHSSTTWPFNVLGTKSSPIPSTFHGRGASPERTEPSGSAPMTLISGFCSFKYRPTPEMVPPVPTPATNAVILPAGLLPDLRAGRSIVDLGVGQVGELVGPPGAGDLARQPVGDAVVALGRVGRDGGRRDHDLGAVGLEQADLLAAHLVRQDEDAAISLDRGGQGQTDAGVAGRGLDDRAAGLQPAALLRPPRPWPRPTRSLMLPPGLSDSSLTSTCAGTPSRQSMKPYQRRPPDRVEHGVARSPSGVASTGVSSRTGRPGLGAIDPRLHVSLPARRCPDATRTELDPAELAAKPAHW